MPGASSMQRRANATCACRRTSAGRCRRRRHA